MLGMTSSGLKTVHDATAKNLSASQTINFADFKDKVLIVVNVASKWGLTKKNYTQLVQLHEKYHSQGLEIFAFPCNQFGAQEPGTPEEIREFVDKFNVKFHMMEKIKVNGPSSHPLFQYLKKENGGAITTIAWNFTKFLVGPDGKAEGRWGPKSDPNDMIPDIEKFLAKIGTPKESENDDAKL